MSAGTSISGGIGGIFYSILLLYGLILKRYKKQRVPSKSLRYAIFGSVILTFLILMSFNLINWGYLDLQETTYTMIQKAKDDIASAAEGLLDDARTVINVIPYPLLDNGGRTE